MMRLDASETRARAGKHRRGAFLMTALLCAGLVACGDPPGSAEEQVRAWVDRGHEAAEAKDRDELVGMISPTVR